MSSPDAQPLPEFTRADFAKWGSTGGAKVTGAKKKRSKAHYRRISALGVAARAKKQSDSKPVVA